MIIETDKLIPLIVKMLLAIIVETKDILLEIVDAEKKTTNNQIRIEALAQIIILEITTTTEITHMIDLDLGTDLVLIIMNAQVKTNLDIMIDLGAEIEVFQEIDIEAVKEVMIEIIDLEVDPLLPNPEMSIHLILKKIMTTNNLNPISLLNL